MLFCLLLVSADPDGVWGFCVPVFLGGTHASLFPEHVMQDLSWDFAVFGEGEETSVEGITIDAGKNYESTRTELYSTVPARFTIRPHMGVDFQLGALAIAAQVDFAFMNNEQVSTDVDTGALDDFDPAQEGGVFGDASQESQTSAAVVGSLAIRVVF